MGWGGGSQHSWVVAADVTWQPPHFKSLAAVGLSTVELAIIIYDHSGIDFHCLQGLGQMGRSWWHGMAADQRDSAARVLSVGQGLTADEDECAPAVRCTLHPAPPPPPAGTPGLVYRSRRWRQEFVRNLEPQTASRVTTLLPTLGGSWFLSGVPWQFTAPCRTNLGTLAASRPCWTWWPLSISSRWNGQGDGLLTRTTFGFMT